MGQIEVFEFLKTQRLSGNEDYFSIEEIKKGIPIDNGSSNSYRNVRSSLIRLERHGYLETKMTGNWRAWHRLFRLKEKYIKRDYSLR